MNTFTMKEWPSEDRPYEKLQRSGAASLSTAELVSILLVSGTKEQSALDIAKQLLYEYPLFNQWRDAELNDLIQIKGIGKVKALRLKAIVELSHRIRNSSNLQVGETIDCPSKAISYLEPLLLALDHEEIVILLLDPMKRLIRHERVALGGVRSAQLDSREVFRKAIRCNASSLILAHNHPSGNSTPSDADIRSTQQLVKLAESVGIEINDHIIIAKSSSISMKQAGYL